MRQTRQNVSPMSNEGRNAYVMAQLNKALLILLSKKPLNDISISELVDEAGVGRASFYRNFDSKEDILKLHIRSLFNEWIKEWDKQNVILSEQIYNMIQHFEKHNRFYKLLNERGLIYLLKDVIIGFFKLSNEDVKEKAYASAFAAYTLYGWIDVWFQRGMRESADEMAEMFKSQGL